MISIKEKTDCCGCTACMNICPKNAIEMKPDFEGFLYPDVNTDICVNCGLCEKVCPVKSKVSLEEENTLGYIVRNKDLDIVKDSTSGGAFSVFAKHVFENGGIVYGAGYDADMNVVCKKATNMAELAEMRGSKFVQSNLDRVFSEIKEQLNKGVFVMFTGTPCQVSGLISYIGKKPDNLLCIDFVCRGVPSPKLWRNYLNMMQKRYKSKVVAVKFKNKTYGYHATTMKVDFANGKTWYGSGRIDPMMKAFVKEMASRPSCGDCHFKGIQRPSDITMFDCYEFAAITGKKDDDMGYTSLFIHSCKGIDIFDKVRKEFLVIDVAVDDLVTENGIMVCNSAKPSDRRTAFYDASNRLPIDEAMNVVLPIEKKDYFIEKCKSTLYRLGLIPILKKLKNEKIITR